ncbi:aldehyde dehydrogenase family protein [Shinella sp. CPCC 100929]|uniref:Aldehyde dehydrogenase family protein n=1 Tax=Shinella lacus TaxID=2654216 RepID=A0ABT1R5M6_9HYPH|nr:aldehyde dehydrogenase family protein [Shinella lacus]MCQ4630471.1 aldehyde dehydrogenase family protein [Shinella lacus]
MAEKAIVTTNPATGAEIAAFEPHDDAYVDRALTAAADAQKAWRRVSVDDRAKLLAGMARVLRAGKPKYAAPITQEMGKPIVEAEAEIEKCAYNCDFYATQAGKALKKQVLELSGSDAFIVLADANLDEAVAVAVKARYINVGQSCVNAKRFIVEDSIADRFVALFCAGVAKLKVGDPTERDTNIGPMARENLMAALHAQVEKTIAAGAELKAGGAPVDRPGYFYAPTALDHVTPDMVAFCEVTFGPVAAIIRAKDAEDAVRLANQTEFGLGSAIWTRNIARARTLARDIDAGAVVINGMVASDPRYPFGGIKRSGYGRELGVYGIREFVNIKSVWIGPAKPAA